MFKKQLFFLTLILLLAACAPTHQATPDTVPAPTLTDAPTLQPATETAPAPSATEAPTQAPTAQAASEDGCPAASAELNLMVTAENGFCLLYPAEFTWDGQRLIVLNPTGASGDVPGEAWLLVSISEAGGQTAAQIADAQIAEAAGLPVARTELTVDGRQAILVDGMPAQDSVRYLYIVNNDRLYRFEFMPWYPSDGTTPLEKLYQAVVDSVHFLP